MKPNNYAVVATPPGTCATNATTSILIDKTGFNFARFVISPGTFSTEGETFRTITLKESDTSTSYTSHSTVTGANFATTTSTSATQTMPAVTELGLGPAIIMDVDLRKRKKYVSVQVTPGATTSNIALFAILAEPSISKDSTTTAYVKNWSSTTMTAIADIVTF